MKKDFRENILRNIEFIEMINKKNKKQLVGLINSNMKRNIQLLEKLLKRKSKILQREVTFGSVKRDLGVDFGLSRTNERTTFADWILDLQPKTRNYILLFLNTKEILFHFFSMEITEVDEVIMNIITILFIKELFKIKTLDNPVLSAIRSKIYSEDIAGQDHLFWDNLLLLLIKKNIDFKQPFMQFAEITQNEIYSSSEKVKMFANWIMSKTVRDEDVIAPIYTNMKLVEMIETLLEVGYEKANTSHIAQKLNLYPKTIANRFKSLNASYSTIWRSDINYEELNLHNYFIKIITDKNDIIEKLKKKLLGNPYLKTLYQGFNSQSNILYSPSLICPHILSEQLNESFQKMAKKGLIKDFSVQLVREKHRYFALTNYPYEPSMSTFRKLIYQGDSPLRQYTFSHEKRRSVLPIKNKQINLDYNLLYFLSIITGKYLLQARYLIRLNEFKKFYTEKNIPLTDVDMQTDLLYQNELRAKKKKLLSFSLFMRNLVKRGNDVLIFEIPTSDNFSSEKLKKVIDKLRVFSFTGQITLYDRNVFQIPGVTHNHPIREIIQEFLESEGFVTTFYTIKLYQSKYVPLQELYDYEEKKWKISDY